MNNWLTSGLFNSPFFWSSTAHLPTALPPCPFPPSLVIFYTHFKCPLMPFASRSLPQIFWSKIWFSLFLPYFSSSILDLTQYTSSCIESICVLILTFFRQLWTTWVRVCGLSLIPHCLAHFPFFLEQHQCMHENKHHGRSTTYVL